MNKSQRKKNVFRIFLLIHSSLFVCVCVFSDRTAPPELPIVIDHVALKDILGPPLFELEVRTWNTDSSNGKQNHCNPPTCLFSSLMQIFLLCV